MDEGTSLPSLDWWYFGVLVCACAPLPLHKRLAINCRCPCGVHIEEGAMVQCSTCLLWQHTHCLGLDADNIPEDHTCSEYVLHIMCVL